MIWQYDDRRAGADKLVRVPVIGAPAAQGERTVSQYSSMSTLSLPVRLAFGIGQLAEAVKNQGFNVFLLFFTTKCGSLCVLDWPRPCYGAGG